MTASQALLATSSRPASYDRRVKIGRNEPCPCGSGKKFKRCCDSPDGRERLERVDEARAALFSLASLFPRLRPDARGFDAWLAGLGPDLRGRARFEGELIEAGIDAIREAERVRILAAAAALWAGFSLDPDGELVARDLSDSLVLGGSVAAALRESPPLDPVMLQLLEDEPEDDPREVLSLALSYNAADLWSISEASEASRRFDAVDPDDELDEEAFERAADAALRAYADEVWTDGHDRRMRRLLSLLADDLPRPDFPAATAKLGDARKRAEAEPAIRRDVAAALLLEASALVERVER